MRRDARYSFVSRASLAAATFPLTISVPGAVNEKIVVPTPMASHNLSSAERDHSGVGKPEGSPPLSSSACRPISHLGALNHSKKALDVTHSSIRWRNHVMMNVNLVTRHLCRFGMDSGKWLVAFGCQIECQYGE